MQVEKPQTLEGLVLASRGTELDVQIEKSQVIACVLRGRLRRQVERASSPVVVGDLVRLTIGPHGKGAVESILPRRNKLARPGFRGIEHPIAANMDRLAVVASVKDPPFRPTVVERLLVLAHESAIDPLLVVTKCDLEPREDIEEKLHRLDPLGLSPVLTSARTGEGIDELRARLGRTRSVLLGQSGVGKSSLLNALFPGLAIVTRDVGANLKGRHTTTATRSYLLPEGGLLVDTPGIKTLAFLQTPRDGLREAYPDIDGFAADCRFRDCSHRVEPDCAVRDALARGEIEEARYRSFLRVQGI